MSEVLVFELPLEAWISAFVLLFFVLLILYIAALFRVGRLRKKLNQFLNGSQVAGLEGVLADLHAKTDKFQTSAKNVETAITELQKKTASLKGNVAVARYNAFAERGSDLSFSVAMLDDNGDGVVMTTIHTRGESMVYAKPLQNGTSKYTLTPEEKDVIHQAIQPKQR